MNGGFNAFTGGGSSRGQSSILNYASRPNNALSGGQQSNNPFGQNLNKAGGGFSMGTFGRQNDKSPSKRLMPPSKSRMGGNQFSFNNSSSNNMNKTSNQFNFSNNNMNSGSSTGFKGFSGGTQQPFGQNSSGNQF